ncbi:GNAT family N-acetyltransferase [Sphingomonas paucimobilis]|uniref:GNAT family N-acetyltransferase n=1 Tax=Sphingomonas paucimobilis TaxID=13689 RepID=UPI0028D5F6E2|nr:GNAT family N-acetyltransferase [Sphingomonas paucimobilis]
MVALRFRERTEADPTRGWVPTLFYDIIVDENEVGQISLRLGDNEHLRLYGGQVGYRVRPEAQGRGVATTALVLLKSIAVASGFTELWITTRPDNIASRRVLDKVGAVFIEALSVPQDTDLFARGDRSMCRYRLLLP